MSSAPLAYLQAGTGTFRRDAANDDALFEHAPPTRTEQRLGLLHAGRRNVVHRAVIIVLIGWLPLIILALFQGLTFGDANQELSLLKDAGVHARYLIAAPLLVLAEALCAPRLNAVIRNFPAGGFLAERDRPRFEAEIASTQRLLRSSAAEAVAVALAYLIVVAAILFAPLDQLPVWHRHNGFAPMFSLAGWWHTLVSLPLLLVLSFGWLWRIALWTRLLGRIARFNMRLVSSHPDHVAGLSFIGHSVRAFSIVAAAFTVIAAGRSGNVVIAGGSLPTFNLYFNIGLLIAIALLFVGPLIVFQPPLLRAWESGTLEYGALAAKVGKSFEDRWLAADATIDEKMLGTTDFSATTDLYSITANVYAIRFLPLDLKDLITLGVAMAAPFVPVVLMAFPLKAIVHSIRSLLV